MSETEVLSAEELHQLQINLVESRDAMGCMPLDMAHGFLSALAAHQQTISVQAAYSEVLGGLAEMPRLVSLIEKLQQQILHDLRNSEYAPLILALPREGADDLPLPYGWCEGYTKGLHKLGEAVQEQVLQDTEAAEYLAPIMAFMIYEEAHLLNPPNEQAHRETAAQLGNAAVCLYQWWEKRLKDSQH